jgi:hypothetical protein
MDYCANTEKKLKISEKIRGSTNITDCYHYRINNPTDYWNNSEARNYSIPNA